MVVLFLRFYGPKPVLVYPFGLPLSTWFSGHISALRDTEGHKYSPSLLSVCDFVRKIESVQIVCEASALPLSQAGECFRYVQSTLSFLESATVHHPHAALADLQADFITTSLLPGLRVIN
jgi:hypothetical protein